MQTRVGAEHFRGVLGLEFEVPVAVDDAGDHFFHGIGQAMIGGEQIVEALGGLGGRRAFGPRGGGGKIAKLLPDEAQAIGIVLGHVMSDAADGGVHVRAAERFGVDDLPHRALHQIGPAEAHEAGFVHHEDHVAERGQISAAGDAGAHDGGDLRHLQLAAHQRVVIENPRRAVLAWKDAVLVVADSRRPNRRDRRWAGGCAWRFPARGGFW